MRGIFRCYVLMIFPCWTYTATFPCRPANTFVVRMMATNTAADSPSASPKAGPAQVTVEEFRAAAQGHAQYMDERNIDVQVIGPRPFMALGWMEPHLLPAWARYVNDMIRQQCEFFPDRFLWRLPAAAGQRGGGPVRLPGRAQPMRD